MKQALLCFLLVITFTFAFGQSDSDSSEVALPSPYPDIFGFMEEKQSLLKVDLLGIVQNIDETGFSGQLQIAYETKISTPWSINSEFGIGYAFKALPTTNPSFQVGNEFLSISVGPRYYYDLRKRIEARTSVDNLSANYLTVTVSSRIKPQPGGLTTSDRNGILIADNLAISPMLGVQRRLLGDGFVDFSIGFKFSYGDPVRTKILFPRGADIGWQLIPITKLRLGLAF